MHNFSPPPDMWIEITFALIFKSQIQLNLSTRERILPEKLEWEDLISFKG